MNFRFLKISNLLLFLTLSLSLADFCSAADEPATDSLLNLQIPIFDYAQSSGLPEYIANIFTYAMIILVPLAIIMVVWGGIQWVGAAGNSQKIGAAKKQISSAILGLILGLLTYTLLSYVGITQLYMGGLIKIQPIEQASFFVFTETDLGGTTPPAGMSPSDFTASKGANPFQSICDEYNGIYNETVALKCKALGTSPAVGSDFVKSSDGYQMDRKFNIALEGARACLKQKHTDAYIKINCALCAFRSPADQYAMWQEKQKPGAKGIAAKPCCSNHGGGVAADISTNYPGEWTACLNQNELFSKVPKEAWHWSFSGY